MTSERHRLARPSRRKTGRARQEGPAIMMGALKWKLVKSKFAGVLVYPFLPLKKK